jgi:GNAT superfamily N-acetyltransferase
MSQQTISFDNVQRRRVRESDRDFLLRVYASFKERDRELADVEIPDEIWNQFVATQFDLQHNHYLDAWSDGGSFEVIELKGKPIGRIYLWRGLDKGVEQIRIVEFTLLTEYRNHGIGSHLMKEVLAWADEVGLPVRTRLAPFELSRPFL